MKCYMYIYEDVIIIGGKWDFEIIYFIVYMWYKVFGFWIKFDINYDKIFDI